MMSAMVLWVDVASALAAEDEFERPTDGWAGLARAVHSLDALRPEWQSDALCLEYPEVEFFVTRGESSEPAKAVCSRCLVQDECLAFAIAEGMRFGIWAGRTPGQLKKLRADLLSCRADH